MSGCLDAHSVTLSSEEFRVASKALSDPFLPEEFTLEDFQAAFDRANLQEGMERLKSIATREREAFACGGAKLGDWELPPSGGQALAAGCSAIGVHIGRSQRKDGVDRIRETLREFDKQQELKGMLGSRTPHPGEIKRSEVYPDEQTLPALKQQVGGGHYKGLAIQPVEYCQRNGLGFCESSVVKYVTRWKEKAGVEDLKKAKHFIDLLIELTEADANKANTYCQHAQVGYDG